jgi:hypothetical protein
MMAGKNTHSEIGATTFEGRSSAEASPLEAKTLEFFLYIAGEAIHWDWTPPIEGLYQFTNEQKGRFTHLKRCGLLAKLGFRMLALGPKFLCGADRPVFRFRNS